MIQKRNKLMGWRSFTVVIQRVARKASVANEEAEATKAAQTSKGCNL